MSKKNLFLGKLKEYFLNKEVEKVSDEVVLSVIDGIVDKEPMEIRGVDTVVEDKILSNAVSDKNAVRYIIKNNMSVDEERRLVREISGIERLHKNLRDALLGCGVPKDKIDGKFDDNLDQLFLFAITAVEDIKRDRALKLEDEKNSFRQYGIDISGEGFNEFELNELKYKIKESRLFLHADPDVVREIIEAEVAYSASEAGIKEKILMDAFEDVRRFNYSLGDYRFTYGKSESVYQASMRSGNEVVAKYFREKGIDVPENFEKLSKNEVRNYGGLRTEAEENKNAILLALKASGLDLSKVSQMNSAKLGRFLRSDEFENKIKLNKQFLADALLEDSREQKRKVETNKKPS